MSKIPEIYGSMVFNEHTMQERLPSATYKDLMKTIKKGEPLNLEVANVVAHAMKEWAIEKGATHYTHWFQPMTGITAEKHDSFIDPAGDGTRHHGASPARSLSRASPTPPASPPAACAPPSRPAATPHGTPPPTPSSRTRCCASPPPSAPTAARRSTRKPRCCAPWSAIDKQAMRVLRAVRRHRCRPRHHHRRRRAGVFPRSTRQVLRQAQGPASMTGRTLFGCSAAQGPGAGGSLLRRHPVPRVNELYEGAR